MSHAHAAAPRSVAVTLPDWIDDVVDWERPYRTDDDKMRLAIALARENVARGTGGPFGAAIVERDSGRLLSVGVNRVVPLDSCTLHTEVVAFMLAQSRLGTFSLAAPGLPAHDLATSCDPCAMCLGATLWSGVRRVLCGATRDAGARCTTGSDERGARSDEGFDVRAYGSTPDPSSVFPQRSALRAHRSPVTGPSTAG